MWNKNLHEIGVEKVMLWWGGEAWRVLEKLRESWKISEGLGGSRQTKRADYWFL